ncbi:MULTISPECIES: hypothetical protein [unclassified Nocardioides]|uniref:hypothetical protein n=1 Tax=unclassified Nocardioides TaxID=2615069 RepID=UPI0000570444|nr:MULTISPECIES: hypothetical protein [unclassified Nocardioides]ABL82009.1 proline rich 12 [Nocardioides sp. JS614]
MGFLDKAKAAANELAAKADTALSNSGLGGPGAAVSPERLLRDLGVVAYLEAAGRPVPEGERERLLGALNEHERAGTLPPLVLQTTPPPAAAPPPAGTVPPPPGGMTPPASSEPAGTPAAATPAPPPPPPSWMNKTDGS